MRHRKKKFQLNRFTSWRKSTLISLARNLLLRQRIVTTKARAKAAAALAERLISLAKKGTLQAARQANKVIADHQLVSFLFKKIAPLFEKRNCGFTRILPLGVRRGDNALLVILELTEKREKIKKVKVAKKTEIKEKIKSEPQAQEKKLELVKKPTKRFLGGLKSIFKKERDAL